MNTDLSFFTNDENSSLSDRFNTLLKHAQFLDILVGYFRFSGFEILKESFKKTEKIRILNGINVDQQTLEILTNLNLTPKNNQETLEQYKKKVVTDLENSDDTKEVEDAIHLFIKYLKEGKIEIRQHKENKIHAKVYICRFNPKDDLPLYGSVITGSSNFSFSGLKGQYEFNVELKSVLDVNFALEHFNKLWEDAIDVKQTTIDVLTKNTWLNSEISPYELYLKVLYENFSHEIDNDQKLNFSAPIKYLNLQYQKDAVVKAKDIIETYNGLIIADVVGLGKTYISALLASQLPSSAKKIFICPPILQQEWRNTLKYFEITSYDIFSSDDQILTKIKNDEFIVNAEYIFIDEAHRFRNADTQSFKSLYEICIGKKVILLTATPLNNELKDILNQLKLFLTPRNSNIPGVGNLNSFFKPLIAKIEKARGTENYTKIFQQCSEIVREKVLSEIMIRRTRTDIEKYYAEDMKKNNIDFPEITDPNRIVYELSAKTDKIFDKTIELISKLKKIRWDPVRFLKPLLQNESKFKKSGNLGAFFRVMLVKRIESSVIAFKNTLRRWIDSHRHAIEMLDNDNFIVGDSSNASKYFDLDEEDLNELEKSEKIERYKKTDFDDNFYNFLIEDLDILNEIKNLWDEISENEDEKFLFFEKELHTNIKLKDKKIIIFSESKETAEFLFNSLKKNLKEKAILFTGQGGRIIEQNLSRNATRELIRRNYDPDVDNDKKDNRYQILIATDVLSEGVNLHRGNIIINYDLPWNPTKVIQRVGRVNRIGTKFKEIFIYNIFPTKKGDTVLNQERNIISKIKAMHTCLGNDARYLSESEDVGSFMLFGGKDGEAIYKEMNKKKYYESIMDDKTDNKLFYLKEIRKVRDNNFDLFEKIKRFPKKIKSSKKYNKEKGVITYMKRGRFKSFLLSTETKKESNELNFIDAIKFFQCTPETQRLNLSKSFYDQLKNNKSKFENILYDTSHNIDDVTKRTSEGKCIALLSSDTFKDVTKFNEDDLETFKTIKKAFNYGKILSVDSNNIWKKCESYLKDCEKENKKPGALTLFSIFREFISSKIITSSKSENQESIIHKKEIILSLDMHD
jgi:ERCC4-related helicase